MLDFIRSHCSSGSVEEMRKLMEERRDFNAMRLPWSFANIQQQIFSEKIEENSRANNRINMDGKKR